MALNTGLKAALPIMDLWEAILPYFCPAKVGAGITPKLEAAKIDHGSFAGGVPPDSSRLAGADASDSPNPGQFSAELYIFEDNTSTICVLEKGASNKLAHITRTHRVNLHWLSEVCASHGIHVGHIGSDDQAGDIFTKAFTDPLKWDTLTKLVSIYGTNIFRSHHGSSPGTKAKALCLRDFRVAPVEAMAKYTTSGKSVYARNPTWLSSEQSGAEGPWRKSSSRRLQESVRKHTIGPRTYQQCHRDRKGRRHGHVEEYKEQGPHLGTEQGQADVPC